MIDPDPVELARAQFLSEWQSSYPETPPISQFFKFRLSKRWARIHSLPESKRYPDTEHEWDVLLDRQNRVIAYLVRQQAKIRVVINYIDINCYLFKLFDLENIGVFVDKEGEVAYQSFTFETIWERKVINPILMLIAQEDLRAFIVDPIV
jgi:hypothetical protein